MSAKGTETEREGGREEQPKGGLGARVRNDGQGLERSRNEDKIEKLPGGEIKRDPEIGKTAIQPEPAQTADLSISGSR